jgi:dipeptide/tripeptide permease
MSIEYLSSNFYIVSFISSSSSPHHTHTPPILLISGNGDLLGQIQYHFSHHSFCWVGYDAQNPCITIFGADQFDHTDQEERNKKSSVFNWRYFIINVGSLISGTIIVWVQDYEGWLWGFTIAALFVALGAVIFLSGSTLYRF